MCVSASECASAFAFASLSRKRDSRTAKRDREREREGEREEPLFEDHSLALRLSLPPSPSIVLQPSFMSEKVCKSERVSTLARRQREDDVHTASLRERDLQCKRETGHGSPLSMSSCLLTPTDARTHWEGEREKERLMMMQSRDSE